MNEQTLLNGQIDKVFADLIDLDLRISKATGRSIGFQNIKDMKHELANNARRFFCLSIEELAYNDVMNGKLSIREAAKKYARSPSTIRRWLDKVQEERG
jgi:hypothetical protein